MQYFGTGILAHISDPIPLVPCRCSVTPEDLHARVSTFFRLGTATARVTQILSIQARVEFQFVTLAASAQQIFT